MRITQQVKQETRQRILDASRELFRSQGFETATTRDIAREAGIATGTLFNYFPTKESIVLSFVFAALEAAGTEFRKRVSETSSLEEQLFALIAGGLRKLRPYRGYAQCVMETCLNAAAAHSTAESIRTNHLEIVGELIVATGSNEPPSAIQTQLYWTLYTGVLAFWTTDKSRNQEDTLALLDQSINMFVAWLRTSGDLPTSS